MIKIWGILCECGGGNCEGGEIMRNAQCGMRNYKCVMKGCRSAAAFLVCIN